MNSLNVNSSEDIKPPPGLAQLGNMSSYQCSSPGSLSKHICAICGDRSSGTTYRDVEMLHLVLVCHGVHDKCGCVLQGSTMVFTVVKVAKASLRGPSEKT